MKLFYDMTSRKFWDYRTGYYLFRSVWPGTEDLLNLYNGLYSIKSNDQILETCFGPGDFAIFGATKLSRGRIHGIDFSGNCIEIAKYKIMYPQFITQCMMWGWFMSIYYKGLINKKELQKMAHELIERKKVNNFILYIEEIYLEYIEKIKLYTTVSPYSYLVTRLTECGLFQPENLEFHNRLFEFMKEVDNTNTIQRIDNYQKLLNDVVDKTIMIKMENFNLSYSSDVFNKVFTSESALIMQKFGSGWIDEMIRVCCFGGIILYAGVRVRQDHRMKIKSNEIDYVVSELNKRNGIDIIEIGEKRLTSWWDTLFNHENINKNIYTPYVLCRKV